MVTVTMDIETSNNKQEDLIDLSDDSGNNDAKNGENQEDDKE